MRESSAHPASSRPITCLVSPDLPRRDGTGRAQRAWAWLLDLARTSDVVLLVCGLQVPLPTPYPAQRVIFLGRLLGRAKPLRRLAALAWPRLVRHRPDWAADWQNLLDQDGLDRLLIGVGPVRRIVIFRLALHLVGAAVARHWPEARIELDMDDLESAASRSVAGAEWRLGRPYRALRLWLTSRQNVELEQYGETYEAVYLAAGEDVPALQRRLAAPVRLRPNRVFAPVELMASAPDSLLFVGSLGYPPNAEAARFLVRRLPPALSGVPRPLRIVVAGRGGDPGLLAELSTSPQVDFYPDAASLAPHYARAFAVLVPLWAGGGSKLKTLEAFAHGRPVISTAEGVRGLAAEPGIHFLPAETVDDFLVAIARLMADEPLCQRLAGAGQALWREQYQP